MQRDPKIIAIDREILSESDPDKIRRLRFQRRQIVSAQRAAKRRKCARR